MSLGSQSCRPHLHLLVQLGRPDNKMQGGKNHIAKVEVSHILFKKQRGAAESLIMAETSKATMKDMSKNDSSVLLWKKNAPSKDFHHTLAVSNVLYAERLYKVSWPGENDVKV